MKQVLLIELISSGRELLIGKTVNTNASWIAAQLTAAGMMISRITTVDDSVYEIFRAISESLERRPHAIVITGGLGPTPDDLTLEGVASALGIMKSVNPAALELVTSKYSSMNMNMTPARRKMAVLPEGSEPIPNSMGTAPGVAVLHKGIKIFCLPGVPSEMRAMFSSHVIKDLSSQLRSSFAERSFIIEGIAESALAPLINKWRSSHQKIYIKSHPKGAESMPTLEIHLYIIGEDADAMREELKNAEESFSEDILKIGGGVRRKMES